MSGGKRKGKRDSLINQELTKCTQRIVKHYIISYHHAINHKAIKNIIEFSFCVGNFFATTVIYT